MLLAIQIRFHITIAQQRGYPLGCRGDSLCYNCFRMEYIEENGSARAVDTPSTGNAFVRLGKCMLTPRVRLVKYYIMKVRIF